MYRSGSVQVAFLGLALFFATAGQAQDESLRVLAEFDVGKQGRLIVVPAKIGGRSVRLLVDTGAARSGFDSSIANALGSATGEMTLDTSAGRRRVPKYRCPPIQLGDVTVRTESPIFCQSLRDLTQTSGADFDGILGMDILRRHAIQIDFARGHMRLVSLSATQSTDLGTAVPISFKSDARPYLFAKCGDVTHEFLIDTGATELSVRSDIFGLLAANRQLKVGPARMVMTACGEFQSQTGMLSSFSLADFQHEEIVCDEDKTSTVGLGYLSRYVLTLDFPSGTAYFAKGLEYSKADSFGAVGIALAPEGSKFVVRSVKAGGPADLAGIQTGDELLAVDGTTTTAMDLFAIRRLLTAHIGHKAVLKVNRDGHEFVSSVTIGNRFGFRSR